MSKEIQEKNQFITPWDYYASLKKGEKSKLVQHLSTKYGLVGRTLMYKLGHRDYQPTFTQLEYTAIMNEINSEEWKR